MNFMPVVSSDRPALERQRWSQSWSISKFLTAFSMALLAPALVFSGLLFYRYITVEQAQLEQHTLQIVRTLRSEIDQELSGLVLSLEALASSPSLVAHDFGGFHKHATAVAHQRPDQHIILSTVAGQPLLDTRTPWGVELPIGDNKPVVYRPAESGRPYISDLLTESGAPSISVTVPVLQDGAVVHLLSLVLLPQRFMKILSSPQLPPNWEAALAGSDGRLIAMSQRGLGPEANRRGRATHGRVSEEPEGVTYISDADGREGLRAYTRSGLTGWSISAGVSSELALVPPWSWRFFALSGGTLLAITFVLAIYFGARVARPLRLSALAASALGRGEPIPSLPFALREVDEVLKALKAASSERHLAEERLRVAHERMTLALSATDMGMWERDLATNHIVWSDAMYRIFGRTPAEFGGHPDEVLSYIYPDDRRAFRATYEVAVQGKSNTFEHEVRLVLPSGGIRWLYRRAFIRRDGEGRAQSVLGVALDVTERKQAEVANAQLAAIVSSSSEAILSVSKDGIIVTWNAGAEQTFGYTAAEVFGMSLQNLFPEQGRRDFERIANAMANATTARMESLCCKKDGHCFGVQLVANPIGAAPSGDAATPSVGLYSVTIRDISERKERDRHLATVMRELTHRSKNLLAIIQAMARQTAIRSESLADFEGRFSGRLQSLSRSHELLIGNDWEGACLAELVAIQRSTFGPRQVKISSAGPKVFLRPEAIVNIGLALHELASNAERHGALSKPAGQVELRWHLESVGDQDRRLRVVWRERGAICNGGLMQRGFGRDIIEHVVPTALGAKADLCALPNGLQWVLDVPSQQFARNVRKSAAA